MMYRRLAVLLMVAGGIFAHVSVGGATHEEGLQVDSCSPCVL